MFLSPPRRQILNRTNNIFELVTVEPIPDRLEKENKDIMLLESDNEEDKMLRLKGKELSLTPRAE